MKSGSKLLDGKVIIMGLSNIRPVLFQDGRLLILDQTQLPNKEDYRELKNADDVWQAIRQLQVRGAPAIGVAAAYGLYIALRDSKAGGIPEFLNSFRSVKTFLAGARPTAVNLQWALDRQESRLARYFAVHPDHDVLTGCDIGEITSVLLNEAEDIAREEEQASKAMGEYGLNLLKPGMGLLTHCNAGALAAIGYGTALAPIYLGQERGYSFKVFADETRPLLQGARLTAWELMNAGVDVTLICDNMASAAMKNGWIQAVLTGCDRMAANGDAANKIGTSGVAILANAYHIPFYIFVPTSTIDKNAMSGCDIPIELRDGEEIRSLWYSKPMAPEGVKTWNPAFDVTDHAYITAVITEKGIVYPPYDFHN